LFCLNILLKVATICLKLQAAFSPLQMRTFL
jgi:hypothetical protein